MAAKTERLEARVSPEERRHIDTAAGYAGESVSSFVTRAAVARADEVIQAHTSMVVPPDWFDRFVASLDQPDVPSAALGRAAKHARELIVTSE